MQSPASRVCWRRTSRWSRSGPPPWARGLRMRGTSGTSGWRRRRRRCRPRPPSWRWPCRPRPRSAPGGTMSCGPSSAAGSRSSKSACARRWRSGRPRRRACTRTGGRAWMSSSVSRTSVTTSFCRQLPGSATCWVRCKRIVRSARIVSSTTWCSSWTSLRATSDSTSPSSARSGSATLKRGKQGRRLNEPRSGRKRSSLKRR
mmetsp:Transcript_7980/g.18839  ORF Transcript_7980/g.18839 Transcript_7980/m.18839 type:complete len:202 (-) Transcript_7980:249-854(-)